MQFDPSLILGEHGGQLAVAFGSGCIAGYGFCMRTVYRLLESKTEKEHQECLNRIVRLEEEKQELVARLQIIEDRLFMGQERQLAQVRESTRNILPELIEARARREKDDGV